jgi:hypothetical protein
VMMRVWPLLTRRSQAPLGATTGDVLGAHRVFVAVSPVCCRCSSMVAGWAGTSPLAGGSFFLPCLISHIPLPLPLLSSTQRAALQC